VDPALATRATTDAGIGKRDALARDYLAAWNSHDAAAVVRFFAGDAVYDDRGAAELARGRSAIEAHVASVLRAFPDIRFEYVRIAHGEDFVGAEWTCTMTHNGELSGLAPTGRSVTSAGFDVATLGDGDLVTHLISFYDGAAIMRDLGLLPARGSRAERAFVRVASLAGAVLRRGRR
jgi:steroid delta-isomerase-like uncharacterized protein